MSDNNNVKISCPECENEFDCETAHLEVGDIVECKVCGATLEVQKANPVVVRSITTYK